MRPGNEAIENHSMMLLQAVSYHNFYFFHVSIIKLNKVLCYISLEGNKFRVGKISSEGSLFIKKLFPEGTNLGGKRGPFLPWQATFNLQLWLLQVSCKNFWPLLKSGSPACLKHLDEVNNNIHLQVTNTYDKTMVKVGSCMVVVGCSLKMTFAIQPGKFVQILNTG